MKQKGASPIVYILVVAILAIGGFVLFGTKDTGEMVKKETGSQQGIAVGEPNPAQPAPTKVTGNPDDVVAAIGASLDAELAATDVSADADFVTSDTDAVNSYADAYDATNF